MLKFIADRLDIDEKTAFKKIETSFYGVCLFLKNKSSFYIEGLGTIEAKYITHINYIKRIKERYYKITFSHNIENSPYSSKDLVNEIDIDEESLNIIFATLIENINERQKCTVENFGTFYLSNSISFIPSRYLKYFINGYFNVEESIDSEFQTNEKESSIVEYMKELEKISKTEEIPIIVKKEHADELEEVVEEEIDEINIDKILSDKDNKLLSTEHEIRNNVEYSKYAGFDKEKSNEKISEEKKEENINYINLSEETYKILKDKNIHISYQKIFSEKENIKDETKNYENKYKYEKDIQIGSEYLEKYAYLNNMVENIKKEIETMQKHKDVNYKEEDNAEEIKAEKEIKMDVMDNEEKKEYDVKIEKENIRRVYERKKTKMKNFIIYTFIIILSVAGISFLIINFAPKYKESVISFVESIVFKKNTNIKEYTSSPYEIANSYFKDKTVVKYKIGRDSFFWDIASEIYGDYSYWVLLYGLNQNEYQNNFFVKKNSYIDIGEIANDKMFDSMGLIEKNLSEKLSELYFSMYFLFNKQGKDNVAKEMLMWSRLYDKNVFENQKNKIPNNLYIDVTNYFSNKK